MKLPPIWDARYSVGDPIMGGGMGSVSVGVDLRTDEPVAIKHLHDVGEVALRALRRESAALRTVRVPGVVTLRDDVFWNGDAWLVFDLVDGLPFPGASTPLSWDELRPVLCALLRVLGRVHALGMLHLDLKPDNVFVDADGNCTLLDLGISLREALSHRRDRGVFEGTLRYAAREQLRGGRLDERTDLYAVGVMVQEALGIPRTSLGSADDRAALPPLVRGLLAVDPAARPASCRAALAELGVPPEVLPEGARTALHSGGDRTVQAFGGPRRMLHHPEILAEVVRAMTVTPAQRVELVASWLGCGIAEVLGDRVVVEKAAVESLQQAAGTVAADQRTRFARAEASAYGSTACDFGALQKAVRIALESQSEDLLDRCMRLVREWPRLEEVAHHDDVLQAAVSAVRRDLPRARLLLEGLPPRSPLSSLILRIRARVAFSGSLEEAAAFVAETEHLAEDPARSSQWFDWKGKLLYRQGRFEEAAGLHERSALSAPSAEGQVSGRASCAVAWLDALEPSRAYEQASRVLPQAARLRMAVVEGHMWWVARSAAYRRGDTLVPDPTLVSDARGVDPAIAAMLAINECAVAWRTGDMTEARHLIDVGVREAMLAKLGPALAILWGLRARIYGEVATPLEEMVSLERLPPRVLIQALRLAGRDVQPALLARCPRRRGARYEVLDDHEFEGAIELHA